MWAEILNQVQELQHEAERQGYPLWYRGQRDAKWNLLSAIHRHVNWACQEIYGQSQPEAERIELIRQVYKTSFYKFRAKAIGILADHEKSDWGFIFAMQHLGIPTRLLDWTENFGCALYFSQLSRARSDDAAIFVLRPEQLNLQTTGIEALVPLGGDASKRTTIDTAAYHPAVKGSGNDCETIAIAPEWTHARMVAQRSAFTLCGALFEPLEQKYPNCITKIVLPSADYDAVEKFLGLAGNSHFGYFPDLEGLRDDLIASMKREVQLTQQERDMKSD